ncbi:MAG: outer membrane lipoprotein carrier protein LolA [Sphingobacteriales bacterium]|nr:outer membrane lipoprotein carrier protein LolA [Sphingobacteriales bacterium]
MIRYFINAALLMILCSTNIWAQYDPAAKKILDATAKKFRTHNSVKADFTVAVENKDADIQEQYKGKLYMQSCSFRLETPELEQFSDGSTTWTYLKENKEIQITENTGDNAELSPHSYLRFTKTATNTKCALLSKCGELSVMK